MSTSACVKEQMFQVCFREESGSTPQPNHHLRMSATVIQICCLREYCSKYCSKPPSALPTARDTNRLNPTTGSQVYRIRNQQSNYRGLILCGTLKVHCEKYFYHQRLSTQDSPTQSSRVKRGTWIENAYAKAIFKGPHCWAYHWTCWKISNNTREDGFCACQTLLNAKNYWEILQYTM